MNTSDNTVAQEQKCQKLLNSLSGTTADKRSSLLRYCAKELPDRLIVKAFKSADTFHYTEKHNNPEASRSLLLYAGFIKAVSEYHNANYIAEHRKCSEKDVRAMEDLHDSRVTAAIVRNRPADKKMQLEEAINDIQRMVKNGVSLQKMTEILHENKLYDGSKEYLRRFLKNV